MIENNLKKAAKYLNIRFPISKFHKDLNYSKGIISEYFNNKREVSEKFKELFENYYKINLDSFENKNNLVKESAEIYSNNDIELMHETVDALRNWLKEVEKQEDSVNKILEIFKAKKEIKKLLKESSKRNDINNDSSKAS